MSTEVSLRDGFNGPPIRPSVLPEHTIGSFPPMLVALPVSSRGHRPKVPQSDQVVGSHREGEHPSDACAASESRLAAQSYGLQPAEHFLDALAESLADPVARVACGARVERGDLLLGHVRRHGERAQTRDEVPVVVVLVRAERGPTAPSSSVR